MARHESAFVVGAVLGSVAGVALGLLRVPQAGWRTRADLSDLAEAIGDRSAHRIETVIATVRDFFGDSHAEPEVILMSAPNRLDPPAASLSTAPAAADIASGDRSTGGR